MRTISKWVANGREFDTWQEAQDELQNSLGEQLDQLFKDSGLDCSFLQLRNAELKLMSVYKNLKKLADNISSILDQCECESLDDDDLSQSAFDYRWQSEIAKILKAEYRT